MNEPPPKAACLIINRKNMELNLEHKRVLAENGLNQNDLPKETESKILSLTLSIASYNRNPTPELKENIELRSANIAHDIYDYLEQDWEDEPDEVEPKVQPKGEVAPAQQQPIVEEKKENKGGFRLFGFLDI